jgi:hypothetical protein
VKKLDAMKSALDDLKIVDVARKPAELAACLKENKEFLRNPEAAESLAMRGFYLANVKGEPGIYSNEGEFRCLMKDGVEYVLRFGNISESRRADSDDDAKKEDKAKKQDKKEDKKAQKGEKKSAGVNRYIFVMAEFNPTAIAKPTLEELPKEEAPAEPKDAAKSAKAEEKPAAKEKPGEAEVSKTDAAAEKPATEKTAAEKPADKEKPGEVEISAKDAGKEKSDAAKPAEKAADKNAKDKKAEDKKPTAEEIKAKREKIEKENKRKLDEYEEKVAEAKKKVKDLNNRFADWYYVIPNSVYEKIHLGRDDIIVKKSAEKKKDAPADSLPAVGGVPPAMLNEPKTNPPDDAKAAEPESDDSGDAETK